MAVGAGDIVRVDVRGQFNAVTAIQNVFHLRNDGTSQAEANVVDDMVEVLETLYALIGAILQVLWVVNDIKVINITDVSDVGIGLFVDTTPGTRSDTVNPTSAYGLILDTARLSSKGRKYFGPANTASYSTGGILGAGTILDLADVGDHMVIAQVATNSTWRYGVQSTLTGVGFLPFLSYGISPTVVTQRRRRIGVGI